MPDDIDEEPGETQSPASRFWLTNDALAVWLLLTLPLILVGSALLGLTYDNLPENWLVVYAFAIATAVAWAFGSGAVGSVLDRLGSRHP